MSKFTLQERFALLTKHQKQYAIEPVLLSELNVTVSVTCEFDTDTLGTFDGKVTRKLPAAKSALKKAYLACQLTGLTQGLGSEGSFNSHFLGGIEDEEILAFVDISRNLEILALARQIIKLGPITANNQQELEQKLSLYSQEQPAQKWILKKGQSWEKGLASKDILNYLEKWPVELEPDFRAMHCPSRQTVIALAAKDLAKRLKSICPQCDTPDFVEKYPKDGPEYLPCEICRGKTTKAKAPYRICNECDYQEFNEATAETASSFYCTICNP